MGTQFLDVVYTDNHILVLNKPAGLLTQDSGTGRDNLEEIAREWIRKEKNKPGKVFLHCVHRIDRAVSGIVLFARTGKALARLNDQIRKKKVEKTYCALVEGRMPDSGGILKHWLRHGDRIAEVAKDDGNDARECVLEYRVAKTFGNLQCLSVQLETGRYHQIRAQLAAMGCPIAGDGKYGARTQLPGAVIALHHLRLSIVHPVEKNPMTFVAGHVRKFGELPALQPGDMLTTARIEAALEECVAACAPGGHPVQAPQAGKNSSQ